MKAITLPRDDLGMIPSFSHVASRLWLNPVELASAQFSMGMDYFRLWQRFGFRLMGVDLPPVVSPRRGDNRFRDDEWSQNPYFDLIKQSYLIAAHQIMETLEHVGGDKKSLQKVRFLTQQYLDAIAPTNFIWSNPQVVRETLSTGGQNLINGFNNLLRDLQDGELRVKLTDTKAFELGKDVATTAGKVIFQNDLMQLLQFEPTTPQVNERPLLIVPPWINKYYILDLRPKNSFIKWATDQGHTVFVISWVNPGPELAHKDFQAYMLEGPIAALDAIAVHTGQSKVNAVGYCLGGTLLAISMAYAAAKGDDRFASGTFFTTLLDFSDPGDLGVFIDENSVQALEKMMFERGYLDGSQMASAFSMLRSNEIIWSAVINNYLMGKDPLAFDLLYWNADSTRMPATMHSFYLRNMYLRNLVREPGGITLGGVPIELSKITVPCTFVSTMDDHIAPWKSTYAGARLLGGPVNFIVGGSGHIAGIVNPPASNKYGFWTNSTAALPASAEAWLSGAQQHAGSWWTAWNTWIGSLHNQQVRARRVEDGCISAVEDAPGSYVRKRADS